MTFVYNVATYDVALHKVRPCARTKKVMRARVRARAHTSGTAAERVFKGVAAIIIAALCGVFAQGWKPAARRKIHPWSWSSMGQGPGCACQGNPESES